MRRVRKWFSQKTFFNEIVIRFTIHMIPIKNKVPGGYKLLGGQSLIT